MVKPAVLTTGSRWMISWMFGRLRVLWIILLASLLLSGCVQYDAGVNFESPNQGEIVQHIKLGEQLRTFSDSSAQQWLNSLESRARQLQGKIKRLSPQEIIVRIPFSSGAELEEKFNQFFNPVAQKDAPTVSGQELDLPKIQSNFSLTQGNFIFWVRNRLIYDLDLRSLGVLSTNGNVIVSPGSLFDLEFSLNTPWGARSVNPSAEAAITPTVVQKGHQLLWKLEPGQLNHLEAVFWLPSPLGIGTLLIVLLVGVGFYLKYQSLPGGLLKSAQPPAVPGL